MNKNITIYFFFLSLALTSVYSQPWNYDFGTETGSFTTSGENTTLLPVFPSGNSKIRIGTGSGGFYLDNTTFPFSRGSFLRISAATNTSVNKFTLYDYTPGKSFTLKFSIRFGDAAGGNTVSAGTWYLFTGDGTSFSGNSGFTGSHSFTGMRFVFGSSGAVSTTYRSSASWVSTGITGTPFSQGENYIVEIYGNNTASAMNYTYGTMQTITSNKWDLWINGVLTGDELSKAQLANDVNIDSWMFYSESSSGNSANIFIDDIDYHNDIAGTPLPVTMGYFSLNEANRSAHLKWQTLNEINNAGFEIERCSVTGNIESNWINAGFVNGSGTVNEPREYIFEDKNLKTGVYKYRIKQKDYNGNFEYFRPENKEMITINKPAEFYVSQNYPNPSNPVSKIDYNMPFDGFVEIKVYDITGKVVKELINSYQKADYYSVEFDGSDLSSGVYIYRINGISATASFTDSKKLLLIK